MANSPQLKVRRAALIGWKRNPQNDGDVRFPMRENRKSFSSVPNPNKNHTGSRNDPVAVLQSVQKRRETNNEQAQHRIPGTDISLFPVN